MKKNKKEILNNRKIIYLDILKIFACFMVIINHTNGFILETKNFYNTTFYCIMFSICKVAVAIFFMITGALVLNKDYSYKKVFKCIFRVCVPIFTFSLFFYIKDVGIHNINIFEFLKLILNKPYILPYWYIYALVGVYLVLPFIQKMVKKFTNKDYIVFILIFLIIPTLIDFLKNFFTLDINYNFQLAFFPIIISVVVCGNYISKMKLSKKIFFSSIGVFISSYFIMFLSMYLPYLHEDKISYILDSWNTFPVILMSISLFYIFRYLFENKSYSKQITNIITIISSTTFGIYLIHTVLNIKLYKLNIIQKLFSFNGIFAITILDILVFIVCMIIIYLLKRIPFIKNFL